MVEYDEIGIWSEVKLAIIKEYASAYARILDATRRESIRRLRWIYIDAYAGPGVHLSKTTGEMVPGSPLIALDTTPPFFEYHFIDTDPRRADRLRKLAGERGDVFVYSADCNEILMQEVFPRAQYRDYCRALCLLDPYNINLSWEVIETAGKMGSVEVFLNLMIMDINRNALRRNPDRANEQFEAAFRKRLQEKAGFKFVSKPMPMKTKSNSVIYYLYFASQKPVAAGIVDGIFNKYRKRQGL